MAKLLVPEERRLLSGRDRRVLYKDDVSCYTAAGPCRSMTKMKGHSMYIGVFVRASGSP